MHIPIEGPAAVGVNIPVKPPQTVAKTIQHDHEFKLPPRLEEHRYVRSFSSLLYGIPKFIFVVCLIKTLKRGSLMHKHVTNLT